MSVLRFHDPPCVMVRIPKTGSTSLVHGLFRSQSHERVVGRFPVQWRSLYAFAFVRHPFARLVSAWSMFRRYRTETPAEQALRQSLTLERVMELAEDDTIPLTGDDYVSKLRRHVLPMTSPFFGLQHVRDVYRFEDFASEYRRLARRLGLEVSEVPHLRNQLLPHYSFFFQDRRDRERAARLFAEDLQTFDYPIEVT